MMKTAKRPAASRATKGRIKAKPLLGGKDFVRTSGRGRKGQMSPPDAAPRLLPIALMRANARLADACLGHPLALAACRSPLEVYRLQASVAWRFLDAYQHLLAAIAETCNVSGLACTHPDSARADRR